MTKKWEPAVSEPRSYILTSRNGAEYRRNRRHVRTTGETFTCPDTHHSDENTDGEHTVNRRELATCDNPSKETEPIHVEEPQACANDASYRSAVRNYETYFIIVQ